MRMAFTSLCLVTAAVGLLGCGGSQDPPDVPGSGRAGKEMTVTAREYLFTPNRITLRGAQGPVTQPVALRNQGELAHNIEISRDDRIVAKLRSFPAGQTRALKARLSPGEYSFLCTVADHDEKGMRGTLLVK